MAAVYDNIIFMLFILIGLFNLAAVVFNWSWYFKSMQVEKIDRAFGRTITRIIYGLIGLLLILFAISTKVGWL